MHVLVHTHGAGGGEGGEGGDGGNGGGDGGDGGGGGLLGEGGGLRGKGGLDGGIEHSAANPTRLGSSTATPAKRNAFSVSSDTLLMALRVAMH